MKWMVIFFLLSGLNQLYSQSIVNVDTVYYDIDWNRVAQKTEAKIIGYKKYNENGVGIALYYWSTGELNSEQFEKNNSREGECKWFYRNGNLKTIGNYIADGPVGEFLYYDSLGNYSYTNVYDLFHNLRARYVEDIEGVKVYDKSDTPPIFDGLKRVKKAEKRLKKFVRHNFDRSVFNENKESFTVVLLISSSGKVVGVQTPLFIDVAQKSAIENMIFKMPNWLPATQDNIEVYSMYSLKITF